MKFRIKKSQSKTVLTIYDGKDSLCDWGAVCLDEEKHIYEKTFINKQVFLHHEYEKALSTLQGKDVFIISLNGYSSLSLDYLQKYGIKEGSYEFACQSILKEVIDFVKNQFNGVRIKLISGASDMGVDKAIESIARAYNIDLLGFSCPEYLLYVKDDDIPVYVASNKDTYADAYIRSLDMLLCTGGREHSLQHDILASCKYGKRVHFIDVLSALSSTGAIPAREQQPDGSMRIMNAPAAFKQNISFFGTSLPLQPPYDVWDDIYQNTNQIAKEVCRKVMSPEKMFQ